MDPVRQAGKGLRRAQQQSDFVVKRPQAHFPAVEKVVDGISATTPFDMEFKTYRKDDNVLLTINFIGSTIFTPACPYRTPPFAENGPPDVFGQYIDWFPRIFPAVPPPSAIVTHNGDITPYGTFNVGEGSDFGLQSAVFSGPVGPWFADWQFNTPGTPSICMVMMIGPAWYKGPTTGGHQKIWTLEGGGNSLHLDGTPQAVNWGPNGSWNLHYHYQNDHQGLYYYPGEAINAIAMWGTYEGETVP